MKRTAMVTTAGLVGLFFAPAYSTAGEWGLGIGVAAQQPPQEGADRQVVALPFPTYEGERLTANFGSVTYALAKTERFSFAVEGQLRFDGYDPEESAALDGLEERDPTLDAGFSIAMSEEWGIASLKVMTDVLGVHKGYEISASYQYPLQSGRWTIVPGITASWPSDELVDYYYGVRAAEATPDRPAYSGGSVMNTSASINATYSLSPRWDVVGGAEYTRLGDRITDSPIIAKDYEATMYSAIVYRF